MSEREIETLKLLKDLLPEYEIYKFYKEPQHCINPKIGEETRECLNRNITARNAFEAEWKAKHGN
ncbi:MAG TPA: hypothetical protein VFQ98_00440 [Gallionella sp.]|nr:hypothetical protein [Gallionella sp.]